MQANSTPPAPTPDTAAEISQNSNEAGARRESIPARDRFVLAGSLLIIALVYAWLGLTYSSLHNFWSPDSGARYGMIRNWVEHGNLIYLNYPNADVDPAGRFHNFGLLTPNHLTDGYAVALPKGFCVHFPPLFPFLSGIFYRLFGWNALTILPTLGGLGTSALVYAIARRSRLRCAPALPLVVGLATPLVLYSCVFWDHSLHMLLMAGAAYCLLNAMEKDVFRWAVGAGALLGLGVWFHELFALFFVALLAFAPLLRSRGALRAALGMIAGFAPLVLAWAVCNEWIYGIPRGPHFTVLNNITHSPAFPRMMQPGEYAKRALLELFGYDSAGPIVALFCGLLLACILTARLSRATQKAAPLLHVLLAVTALGWIQGGSWANGLLQTTPLFLPAFATPRLVQQGQRQTRETSAASLFYLWIGLACLLFTIAVPINPQVPGLDWGNRYLLTMLPLLTLLAARALEILVNALEPTWRWLPLGSAVILVAVSLYSQYEGGWMVYNDIVYFRDATAVVRKMKTPVVVTDHWDLNSHMVARKLPQRQFVVREPLENGKAFYDALDTLHVNAFTFIGTELGMNKLLYVARRNHVPFAPMEGWLHPMLRVRFERVAPDSPLLNRADFPSHAY